eukprot:Nk52_evm9s361 gene=Nk52_evmTU9s361
MGLSIDKNCDSSCILNTSTNAIDKLLCSSNTPSKVINTNLQYYHFSSSSFVISTFVILLLLLVMCTVPVTSAPTIKFQIVHGSTRDHMPEEGGGLMSVFGVKETSGEGAAYSSGKKSWGPDLLPAFLSKGHRYVQEYLVAPIARGKAMNWLLKTHKDTTDSINGVGPETEGFPGGDAQTGKQPALRIVPAEQVQQEERERTKELSLLRKYGKLPHFDKERGYVFYPQVHFSEQEENMRRRIMQQKVLNDEWDENNQPDEIHNVEDLQQAKAELKLHRMNEKMALAQKQQEEIEQRVLSHLTTKEKAYYKASSILGFPVGNINAAVENANFRDQQEQEMLTALEGGGSGDQKLLNEFSAPNAIPTFRASNLI